MVISVDPLKRIHSGPGPEHVTSDGKRGAIIQHCATGAKSYPLECAAVAAIRAEWLSTSVTGANVWLEIVAGVAYRFRVTGGAEKRIISFFKLNLFG